MSVEYCWKDSYGRGVGRVPSHCPSHKETIAGGIICYDKCHNFGSNWYRFGYDCHQRCNHGWSDHGLLCHKSNWGRGVGQARCEWQEWWAAADLGESGSVHQPTHQRKLLGGVVKAVVQAVRKTKLVCGGSLCSRIGKQDCLGLCYPPCPSSNPVWIGCNLCGASCSSYAGGIAPSCMKGVKISPGMEWATCPPGWDYDAGLCYKPCKRGFTGVGPVCWGDAPVVGGKKWVHCGMGAASSSAACASATADQIIGPLEIVAFAATLGTSSAATSAAKATKMSKLKGAAKALKKNMKDVAKDPQTAGSVESRPMISSLPSRKRIKPVPRWLSFLLSIRRASRVPSQPTPTTLATRFKTQSRLLSSDRRIGTHAQWHLTGGGAAMRVMRRVTTRKRSVATTLAATQTAPAPTNPGSAPVRAISA